MARRWLEPRFLTVLGLVSAGLWTFIAVAEEVREGDTRPIDTAILMALRTPGNPADPLGPRWFEEFVRDLTALGSIGILALVVAAVVAFLVLARQRRTALFVAVATCGGALASSGLKALFERPRPDLVPHGAFVYTSSFPSGHAMMSAVVYLTLAALVARILPTRGLKLYVVAVAGLLTLLVGASRIYLAVHWPSDVLAGWAAGSAWALACWAAAQTLDPRHGGGA